MTAAIFILGGLVFSALSLVAWIVIHDTSADTLGLTQQERRERREQLYRDLWGKHPWED